MLDGKKFLNSNDSLKILLYNKPLGEECTVSDGKKKTVFDNLPKLKVGRWIALEGLISIQLDYCYFVTMER